MTDDDDTAEPDFGYEYTVVSSDGSCIDAGLVQTRLNELAECGWRVVSSSTTEIGGMGHMAKRQMIVIMEKKRTTAPPKIPVADRSAPEAVYDDDGTEGYDPSRIPADRFYRRVGSVSRALKADGLVTDTELDKARVEFAKRGGHLLDHLFAFGFVDEDVLRKKAYLFG